MQLLVRQKDTGRLDVNYPELMQGSSLHVTFHDTLQRDASDLHNFLPAWQHYKNGSKKISPLFLPVAF